MCVLARSVFHNYACGLKDHLAQGSEPLLKLFILSSIRCVLVLRAAKYMTLPYAHLLKKTKSSLTSCIAIGFVLIDSRATFDFFYEKKTVRKTSKMREIGTFQKVAIFVYFVAKAIYYCKAKWPIFGPEFYDAQNKEKQVESCPNL